MDAHEIDDSSSNKSPPTSPKPLPPQPATTPRPDPLAKPATPSRKRTRHRKLADPPKIVTAPAVAAPSTASGKFPSPITLSWLAAAVLVIPPLRHIFDKNIPF